MFSIIAAIGKNRELGKDDKLLFRLPNDMKFFKQTTSGHKVLMGRKTWESLPKKLPNRENIVVTRSTLSDTSSQAEDSQDVPAYTPDSIVHDLKEFISKYESSPEEIFVIGGGMLYWEMLKHCQKLYLTEIDATAEADTFFPEFDCTQFHKKIIQKGTDNGLNYTISLYTRK